MDISYLGGDRFGFCLIHLYIYIEELCLRELFGETMVLPGGGAACFPRSKHGNNLLHGRPVFGITKRAQHPDKHTLCCHRHVLVSYQFLVE